jgi:hypothetical protein
MEQLLEKLNESGVRGVALGDSMASVWNKERRETMLTGGAKWRIDYDGEFEPPFHHQPYLISYFFHCSDPNLDDEKDWESTSRDVKNLIAEKMLFVERIEVAAWLRPPNVGKQNPQEVCQRIENILSEKFGGPGEQCCDPLWGTETIEWKRDSTVVLLCPPSELDEEKMTVVWHPRDIKSFRIAFPQTKLPVANQQSGYDTVFGYKIALSPESYAQLKQLLKSQASAKTLVIAESSHELTIALGIVPELPDIKRPTDKKLQKLMTFDKMLDLEHESLSPNIDPLREQIEKIIGPLPSSIELFTKFYS